MLSLSLKGPFKAKDISAFRPHKHIHQLSITNQKCLTADIAKGFDSLQSVKNLWLWCSITRTAMRHIIKISDLEEIDILEIHHPGNLENFKCASALKIFRCNHYLSEADLLEIAKLPKLQALGAQGSMLTSTALHALLQKPSLVCLDIEGSNLTDKMAEMLSLPNKIETLEIGRTLITKKGLKSLCNMPQLKSLDIWATDIMEKDLALLANLSNLESLSIGNLEGQSILSFKGVLPHLKNIPSLKRIWLDGILVTESEKKKLEQHYESVRY